MNKPRIAFFGGEPLSVPALEALKSANITPDMIVCSPDRPAGRGHTLTPPPVKTWALEAGVTVYQPDSYKDPAVRARLESEEWDLFVVVAYNFILPSWLLEIPTHGCLNVHPSLLPALRGPSPIRTAILENTPETVGVTVMLLDEKMDHGPIVNQAVVTTEGDWPVPGPVLDETLANSGGYLLAETIPEWLSGNIEPQVQDHDAATYTKLFKKGENELDLDPTNLPTGKEAVKTLCKIYAWQGIGDTFFIHKGTRVKIKDARLTESGVLEIFNVVPENKQLMSFDSYLQSLVTE